MHAVRRGWINGLVGVVIFAGSLPATRLAVIDLAPLFLTAARAAIAGLLAAGLLLICRPPRPGRKKLPRLLMVTSGVVIGFPLLTALALQRVSSAHSIVFLGLLPLATALFAVLRGESRPRPLFWLFSVLGSACVAGYALRGAGRGSWTGDMLMLAAVIVCGLGYAEGARLSRRLGGWQVISWALVLALPLTLPLSLIERPARLAEVGLPAWLALAYVALFSMLIGFVFWYRGLAQGGVAAVGQLQLLQPFLGLALAAVLLDEPVDTSMVLASALAVACVAASKRFAAPA